MPNITQIAGVIIRDTNGKYLLVQERKETAYGLWTIPGGHVDSGETLQEAAIREAYEETGFRVELIDNEPVLVDHDENPGHVKSAFRAKIIDGNLSIPSDELLDARWLHFNEVLELHKTGKMRSAWTYNAILKIEQ
ncbi:MAG TPA: NUDIX hydrolase [Candidatus Dormibacteraeota bacterium]|nr:NUDIX hydrolase [Candidatus Dormibacteraeota bacterium]